MAVAWHSIFSMDPPAYGVGISKKRFTHGLIEESGAFAVNCMPGREAKLVAAVGGCSGRDVDKFRELGIRKTEGLLLDVPIIVSAYFALECEVFHKAPVGDHDWFVGRVVATHWSDEAFDDEGIVNLKKAKPATYLGKDNYLAITDGRKRRLDRKVCFAEKGKRAKRSVH